MTVGPVSALPGAGSLNSSGFFGGNMTKRGTVLRDTSTGPGLLSVDGNQHQFSLEGGWKSLDPPKPGMHVLVEFATDLTILSVIPIPESQIAREQAEAVMKAAKEKSG